MKQIPALLIAFSLIFTAATATALTTTVSVDTDPVTPGIQSDLDIAFGDRFMIDVVIQYVIDLSAFEFDLDFDQAVLTAVSVVNGTFLTPSFFEVENDVNPPDVNFAEVNFAGPLVTGSGVLATITFDAFGSGTSLLDLNDVILVDEVGQTMSGVTINDGSANVAGAPVPEPSTMLLLGTGLIGLAGFRRKFRK